MEQHGKNHRKNIIAIIPARLASTRLEGKLLLPLNGKPLILHTLEQAKKARNIERVIVAADDEKILKVVNESGNEAVLTSVNHQSGSDRIAEVAENLPENSIIVNVQGDEPLISPDTIDAAVEAILNDENADIATTCEKIETAEDILNPNIVKVVTDENDYAIYFSRSPIPFPRDAVNKFGSIETALQNEPELISLYRKHTGLYVYRREYLLKFTKLNQTRLEKTEMLEQLRALENGAKIKVVETIEKSIGVDTKEDFERISRLIKESKNGFENITIRQVNYEDISQIAAVHVESWQKSFRGIVPQSYLDNLSIEKREKAFREGFDKKNYNSIVAETLEGKIVGFADFGKGRNINNEFESEIYAIYLLNEFQRKGIGEKLFRNVVKKLIENSENSLYLEALEISPFRKFYEKMGGKIIGRGSHKLGDVNYATVLYGWKDLKNL